MRLSLRRWLEPLWRPAADVEIICLANSLKYTERCIAGLRVDGGGWVRPVSEELHGALEYGQYGIAGHDEPQILDRIRIGLSRPAPAPHQPENWLINRARWQLVQPSPAPGSWDILERSRSHGPAIFGNTADGVPFEELRRDPAAASLTLVAPTRVRFLVRRDQARAKRIRVAFDLAGQPYDLSLTDPVWARKVFSAGKAAIDAGEGRMPRVAYLVVSLTEPFEGYCHKVVAGVVPALEGDSR